MGCVHVCRTLSIWYNMYMYIIVQASRRIQNHFTEYNCHSNRNAETSYYSAASQTFPFPQSTITSCHAATVLQVKGQPHPPTMRGVNSKVDRNWRNAFSLAREPVRLCLNLLPYFIKVCVLLTLLVEKLRPLCERKEICIPQPHSQDVMSDSCLLYTSPSPRD